MTWIDWTIVIGLNGSIVLYGLYLSRGTRSAADWFLAGRSLPWWMVGLSLYATAIDSSDLVADSGGTYKLGFSYFVTNWFGTTTGWVLAAFFIIPPMIRAGMYTNAEYLEARFGVAARVMSVFVQVQFRTLVLAIMGNAMFLVLSIVCGWGQAAWWAVAAIAILAAVYTSLGGLRSVAVTDSLQFVIMAVTAIVFWCMVFSVVGGWSGIESRLAAADESLPAQLLHIGHDQIEHVDTHTMTPEQIDRTLLMGGQLDASGGRIERRTPAWLVVIAFFITGAAYAIVNHTQAMRMFASRSTWDLRMSAFVAGAMLIVFSFFNLSMGVMGRALYPDVAALPGGVTDGIFPVLMQDLATVGISGLLVAGVLAATLSTYDSMGSALAALLTRDVYARLLVRDASDAHYLRAGRILTPIVIGVSFLYVPFLGGTMLEFYIELTSAFVVPLLTLYWMGTFTRVHRRSGMIGLVAGAVYGILRLLAPHVALRYGVLILPPAMINTYAAYPISVLITASAMVLASLRFGWSPRGALAHEEATGWLQRSQREALQIQPPAAAARHGRLPHVLAAAVIATGAYLCFVVFW